MGRGPLVRVELGPGRFAKMHRSDAIAAGLLDGKKRQPAEDKMRRPAADKQESGGAGAQGSGGAGKTVPERRSEPETAGNGDDFTVIPGVGPSLAEHLRDCGFETLEELRTADLDHVDARARYAIERWRDG